MVIHLQELNETVLEFQTLASIWCLYEDKNRHFLLCLPKRSLWSNFCIFVTYGSISSFLFLIIFVTKGRVNDNSFLWNFFLMKLPMWNVCSPQWIEHWISNAQWPAQVQHQLLLQLPWSLRSLFCITHWGK